MVYRRYGKTGKQVSVLGFGGMRFEDVEDRDACVAMMVEAAEGGVNYFDTAPKYFGTKSEEAFGAGLAELRRRGLPYYLSTKTFESGESGVRREIEGQLERLGTDHIDFYHVWCITNLENWRERKRNGVIDVFRKLRDEGVVRHICVSSHLIGDEIRELLEEGVFEGVLFGYSAYNFKTRRTAFEAIRRYNLGCAVMNPLGGGIIPQHPQLFPFLKRSPGETVVEGALRFLFSHEDIDLSLVGFGNISHVRHALRAVERFEEEGPVDLDSIMAEVNTSFEGICTGCRYCDDCPVDIPIPKLMDSYNHKILFDSEKEMIDRIRNHWDIDPRVAGDCTECGQCEEACTQHLPIIERLAEVAQACG
ncbi:MAG: aldo/keto reductase [Spirochaetaceae bacterium]